MRTLPSGLLLAALALGSACGKDSPTGLTGVNSVLTLGTAVTVSGGTDSERFFTVSVPASAPALRVSLSGGTGDADLAIRFGTRPTEASFDCGSFGPDNTEECIVAAPGAGIWHIVVVGFEAYNGAQLLAEITAAPTTTPLTLTLGTSVSVSGAIDSERFFTVEVPAGAPALRVALSGGSGDADLAIRLGTAPTEFDADCLSFGPSNNEECIVASPAAGTWHIAVIGFEAYAGAQLLAEITAAPTATVLTSGVALTNQSGAESSSRYFSITVPAGATSLTVTTSGGTGDVDLLVRHNAFPTFTSFNCESINDNNIETCTVNSPAAGTWYVMLYGFVGYSGVTLTATVAGP